MLSRTKGTFARDPFLIWVNRITDRSLRERLAITGVLLAAYLLIVLLSAPSPVLWMLAVVPVVVAAFYFSLVGLLASWAGTFLAAGLVWWQAPPPETSLRGLLLAFGLVLAFGVAGDTFGRFNRHLRELFRSLELVQFASAAITSLPNFRVLAEELLQRTARRLGSRSAILVLADPRTGILHVEAAYQPPAGWIQRFDSLRVSIHDIPLLAQVWRHQEPVMGHLSPADWWHHHQLDQPGIATLFAVPLLGGFQTLGAIVLFHSRRASFRSHETTLVSTVANHLTVALETARRYEYTRRQAITDPLTGLYNRRFLDERLPEEWERALRHRSGVSLLILDLDHFKLVNDTYGHPAGDEVLRQVAQIIEQQTRNIDVRARYGGEEFAIILPHTLASDAVVLAERLRLAIQQHRFRVGSLNLLLTVSIGLASSHPSIANATALLKAADEALYEAKQRGRNRVSTALPLDEGRLSDRQPHRPGQPGTATPG